MLLIGVQPVDLEDYGGSLRPAVRKQIPAALEIATGYLARHGVSLRRRAEAGAGTFITPGLDLDSYEAGRPGADRACRLGDARVLQRRSPG